MNCTEIRPLLSDYYDGEASQDEIARVERHLRECPECRQVLAEYRAIGGNLRAMSTPIPPAGLQRDVWRVIEAQGRGTTGAARHAHGGSRAANMTVLKGGKAVLDAATGGSSRGWGRIVPAVSLVAALLLVLVGVLSLVNRTAVQAAGLREKSPVTDYKQTLHVEFNRAVIPADVIDNTSVEEVNSGSAQAIAVTKTYDNQARVLSIVPASKWIEGRTYDVIVDASKIHTGIADQTLGDKPIKLTFSALAYTPTATSTSTNTPTSTPTNKPTHTPRPTDTPEPTGVAQNTEVVPPSESSPTTQPAPSDTAIARPSITSTATPTDTRTPEPTHTRVPEPTHTPLPPTGTATAAPALTETPTPGRKTTATPTPRTTRSVTPHPSGTPTPRAAATATSTPLSNCNIQPVNGFGKLWRENTSVRSRLGCPNARELGIQLSAEQHFQGGYMFWRGDTKTIYVFLGEDTGQWYEFDDTWEEGEPTPAPLGNPPAGLYEPVRGFGKIWREYPGLRQSLGWATDQETNIPAAWEAFVGGNMIWSGSNRQIRVMFDNAEHTYETYKDTFVTPTVSHPGE